jgi:hypothetical protein
MELLEKKVFGALPALQFSSVNGVEALGANFEKKMHSLT